MERRMRSSSSSLASFMGGGRRERELSSREWAALAISLGFDPQTRAVRVGRSLLRVIPRGETVQVVLES